MVSSLKEYTLSIAVVLIVSLSSLQSYSQTTRFNILGNIVKTNFNFGNTNSTLKPYKKSIMGLQLGASFQAGISGKFSVVPEFYFMEKGGTLKDGNPLTSYKSKIRFNTLEMPVLACIHVGRVYINSGPYVAYNLSGRLKTEDLEKSRSLSCDNTIDGFRHWELGVQAGAGYIFPFKKASMAIDVRYGYGLTNISWGSKRYNRVLNISVLISKPWKKNPFAKKRSPALS